MSNRESFPYAQVAIQQAVQNKLAPLLQVRRDIAQPLLEEVGRQRVIATQQPGEDLSAWQLTQARALLTALICLHTAIEAWLNRTLEDEHPVVWPEVDRMDFMAKVRLLAKLMKSIPPTLGRIPYDGTLDSEKVVYMGLQELNKLRNAFVHYKAKQVEIASPDDPYEKLNKLPGIIKSLDGLSKYGLQIPSN